MNEKLNQELKSNLDETILPLTSLGNGNSIEVTSNIYCLCIKIVNVCFVGDSTNPNEWVLIDTGMPKSMNLIIDFAEEKFGKHSTPKAIILTHGHFDHVGSAIELIKKWDVPVYAHKLEIPYLNGEKDYPDPDGSVEGGFVAKISPLFPNEGIDLGNCIHELPPDGSVPHMPGWSWIHTPGHTPGHISLFRNMDGFLIAGDAFVTVRQDSLYKVLIQQKELNGPPRYLTTDWENAWESIKILEKLNPKSVVTGHGLPMFGEELRNKLHRLVKNFDKVAIPDYGRYI
ncbi:MULTISPECIES: MBL fold metallo-hydrolase [unclassified Bacillus (in: firmicutes)]|uniref:MBL fold metallo-hydrolase n=1 Tax=unclassified Bacillus (in: firmicutes) TaxID=185979 RepID=UPI0008E40F63|nr:MULTISPECIES: MBL fold metallo-hydrolase [unclassified Bacillus (in: firmicutes)]SFH95767.1 Glyoxylase, beta-lactamase superfamily II [Bacillus sp. 71mf]SFS94947.1 Glyoxylase, beta-lactamase superfamily II [Bacillus sp. 103mf]